MLLFSCVLVYWPGIEGPFIFDDIANIVSNDYLRISSLDADSLSKAAFTSEAGALKRPIPMLSFALNYYFADGYKNVFHYKITNVAIHAINGLLIFWFTLLVTGRLFKTDVHFAAIKRPQIILFSFIVALLWVLHPIHLTSVLYVVQRMTSMSTMFVLLSLIAWFYSRLLAIDKPKSPRLIIGLSATILFGVLGVLSKENAALIPVYIILIEMVLFPHEKPWLFWKSLDKRKRLMITALAVVTILIGSVLTINYFSAGYTNRNFTMAERILTESRILLFYLFLIFLPRIDAFGIYHDDIPVSTTILVPWSTLPSVILIFLMFVIPLFFLTRQRLLAFAFLWFLAGHLMESTIIPLELAHEHRNYLASWGPILSIVYLTYLAAQRTGNKKIWIVPGLFLLLFSINTSLRAWHWSDLASQADFEARNHPRSARAQASLGSMLAKAGKLEEAKQAFLRASSLRPYEVTDLINTQIILAWQKQDASDELRRETLTRVRHGSVTPLTTQALEYAVNCAPLDCAALQDQLLTWLPIYISRVKTQPKKYSYFQYLYAQILFLKGKRQEAVLSLDSAISAYSSYLHPYFFLAEIYIHSRDLGMASDVLTRLKLANANNPHPRDREIQLLSDKIQKLKVSRNNFRPLH